MADPVRITRAAAARKFKDHWAPLVELAKTLKYPGVPKGSVFENGISMPDWRRVRNYEYEKRLSEVFGGEWVVAEWCPFNGIFCRWAHYAPRATLEERIAWFRSHVMEMEADGLNAEWHAAHLEKALKDHPR